MTATLEELEAAAIRASELIGKLAIALDKTVDLQIEHSVVHDSLLETVQNNVKIINYLVGAVNGLAQAIQDMGKRTDERFNKIIERFPSLGETH